LNPFPKDFHLRRGTTDDVDLIRRFTRAAYGKWIPLIGREPLPMAADYEITITQHRFDLLYKGSTLAALIETIVKEDHLHIQNLCVSPDFQRLGLGSQLLNYAQDLAVEEKRDRLRLDTNKRFTGNVDLYLRHGFKIDWEKPIDGGVHVHMVKSISNNI